MSKFKPTPKFDVGYENEIIGRYEGKTPEDAIKACKEDMRDNPSFEPDTPIRDRIKGLIATPVNPPPKRSIPPSEELSME